MFSLELGHILSNQVQVLLQLCVYSLLLLFLQLLSYKLHVLLAQLEPGFTRAVFRAQGILQADRVVHVPLSLRQILQALVEDSPHERLASRF